MKNIEGKGEIARNEQFLLFLQCFFPFYHIDKLLSIFATSEIVVYKLFHLDTVQNWSNDNG